MNTSNYSLVIVYSKRKVCSSDKFEYDKYEIFNDKEEVLCTFNCKSEFKIWLDLNNYKIGKQMFYNELSKKFNKIDEFGDYVMAGKSFELEEK